MAVTVPDAPEGWRQMSTDNGNPRFDSADRHRTIICRPVSTASGTGWTCVLYESDNPYQMGKLADSVFAVSEASIPDAIRSLDQ